MLQEKAVIVRFNTSAWTAKIKDKKISKEIEDTHNAHDAGEYVKQCIARDAVRTYQGVINEARAYHYSVTLPWSDNGDRLLPVAMLQTYKAKMKEYEDLWNETVDRFETVYPSLIEEARQRLNGMFNPDDYPAPYRIRGKFDFNVKYYPVPSSSDFRVNLNLEEVESLKAELSRETDRQKNEAIKALWEKIYYPMARMVERLSKPGAVFRDSLIGNVQEVLTVIDALNFEEDPAITNVKSRIQEMLYYVMPEDLRKDRLLRDSIANKAMSELRTIGREIDVDADETIRKLRIDSETATTQKRELKTDERQMRFAM